MACSLVVAGVPVARSAAVARHPFRRAAAPVLPAVARPSNAFTTLRRSPLRRDITLTTKASAVPATAAVTVKQPEQAPWWQSLASAVSKVSAAVCLGVAILVSMPGAAEAARSGGRVGGNSFNRSSSAARSTSTSSHTTVVVHQPTPMFGFGFMPTFGFGGMGYGGYGMGMGYGYGGGMFLMFKLLFVALAAYMLITAMSSFMGGSDDGLLAAGETCSVIKLQVGLLGLARDLQKDLDTIAGNADTSSPEGLQYVLQETVLALLRNPDYCVYGYSEASRVESLDEAEGKFNEKSLTERGKFKNETLSNFGGNTKTSIAKAKDGMSNELIVVTLLVAAEGRLKLPEINSLQDMKDSLSKLGGVGADNILAVEVLWTPQEAGDSFTNEELITDYPMLNPL